MKALYTAFPIPAFLFLRSALLPALWLLLVCNLVYAGTVPNPPLTNDAPVQRIIPLYGALTESLLAMGLEDLLIARTAADTQPALATLPSVGTHMRPNLEKIVALKPDMVLQFAGREEAGTVVEQLRQLGIPVRVFHINTFEELFDSIRVLGRITQRQDAAHALEARLRARLAAVSTAVSAAPRPTVFFEVRSPNLLGAGQASIVNAIIEAAGGRNCLDYAQKQRTVRLNEEQLIRLQPDVYLYQQGPMNSQPVPPEQRPLLKALHAVQNGKTLLVKEELFSRPSPKAVDAVEELAHFLHP